MCPFLGKHHGGTFGKCTCITSCTIPQKVSTYSSYSSFFVPKSDLCFRQRSMGYSGRGDVQYPFGKVVGRRAGQICGGYDI